MAKLFPILKWFWAGVVLVIGVAVLQGLVLGDRTPVELLALWRPWLLPGGVLLTGLGVLTWFSYRAHQKARCHDQFLWVKATKDLRPEDLGYQPREIGQQATVQQRPHYPAYKARTARDHRLGGQGRGAVLTEDELLAGLRQGRGVLLIGPPVAGKTRTVYELLRRLEGWEVARPRPDQPAPADVECFRGKQVALLLDDLHKYAEGRDKPDLEQLAASLAACASRSAVAATCRDGSPLEQARQASNLQRIFEDIPHKLALQAPSPEDKRALADELKLALSDADVGKAPTYGFLTMNRSLEAMHRRYQQLGDEARDALSAIKALDLAGVRPFTLRRIEAVAEKVCEHKGLQVRQATRELAEQSFLRRPPRNETVDPEPAYLDEVVAGFEEGMVGPTLERVGEVLRGLGDAEGLAALGVTYGAVREEYEEALAAFEAALQVRPEYPEALAAKGGALGWLGRYEETLAACEAALKQRPDFPEALSNKGVALGRLGRGEEALAAYEAALELRPEYPEALHNKGVALERLGRIEEALAAYEAALKLRPEYAEALHNKGVALERLGRIEEALAAYEAALKLRPEYPEALFGKGAALGQLGRIEEELAAYEAALKLRAEDPEALLGKGRALGRLGRIEEALAACEAALELRPEYPEALFGKGVALGQLGRNEEAIAALEAALALRPEDENVKAFLDGLRGQGAAGAG